MGVLPDWMIERDVKIEPFSPQQHRPGVISYGVTSYGYDVRIGYKFKVFKPYPCHEIDPKNFNPEMLEEVNLSPRTHSWRKQSSRNPKEVHWKCHYCGETVESVGMEKSNVCNTPNFIRIPPHSFILGESFETFTIPRDVLCIVVGKSTYARCGLIVNVTPGEPDWCGKWTIEISNTTPLPARVYCGEGIMQAIFIRSDGMRELLQKNLMPLLPEVRTSFIKQASCNKSYADKKGKYQNQEGLTLPVVEGDKK